MLNGLNSFNPSLSLVSIRFQEECCNDTLSRRYGLLSVLEAKILGFYSIKTSYIEYEYLKKVVEDHSLYDSFTLQGGLLFMGNKHCIPKNPLRDLIAKEAHRGRLIDHFGINKTLEILKEHFYRPKIDGDVDKMITRCGTYYIVKSHFCQGLYTPVSIRSSPWDDITINFIVASYRLLQGKMLL